MKDRGYTVVGGTAIQTEESRAWAKKSGVTFFESVKELGMYKSTIRPEDKKRYAKVKGEMKKKGKSGPGGDPKAFKSFKKKAADLQKRQADKRRSALDKLFKRADDWLKMCKKVKDAPK